MTTTTTLPGPLRRHPDLDAWLAINTDQTISLFTGKVEIGQGIRTALAQIGAEELDVALARIRVLTVDTGPSDHPSPDEGYTAGSGSIEDSGGALRLAAAEARQLMLEMAAEKLGFPAEFLVVEDGAISDPAGDNETSYWELMAGRRFARKISGLVNPKPPQAYSIVGQSAAQLDLPAKVTGAPCFVADMELPGLVHGRIVRPPHPHSELVALDDATVRAMPGVLQVVRDGSFLGVIAEREEQAVRAMQSLHEVAQWQVYKPMPTETEIYQQLLSKPSRDLLVVDGTPGDQPIPPIQAPANAATTVSAAYFRPFHMHASLGPSAAIAHFEAGKLTIWSHSQGVYPLRASLAQVLDMADEEIRLIHVEGPGCYGHNGADDVAMDAALLARALPGQPVLLQWTRSDEHAWEPYGSAMVVKLQASLDDAGKVIDWNHDTWSYTHSGRPRPFDGESNLMTSWQLASPWRAPIPQPGRGYHGGIHRNADPIYNFSHRRIVKHLVADSPLRTSSMRSLGAYANVFAIESFMDELAAAAGVDPVEFRLRHLNDERARAVIEAAARAAEWQTGPVQGDHQKGWGRGIGFARYKNQKCYVAVIVEVTVDRSTGAIQLKNAIIAADAGRIINPDGLCNQLEGGLIQSASWTLKEQVTFDEQGITSLDWHSYPILTFPEAPMVETILIDYPEHPPLGSGEATQGPTPAAIANAVFAATGVRLRQIPFRPAVVLAALREGQA
jgi:nicotinate dehydrogenase subunit B